MDSLRGPELSQQPLSLQCEERSRLRREKGKEIETEHRRRECGLCGRWGGGAAGGQKAAGLGCLPGSGQSLSCCSPRTRLSTSGRLGQLRTRGADPSDTRWYLLSGALLSCNKKWKKSTQTDRDDGRGTVSEKKLKNNTQNLILFC